MIQVGETEGLTGQGVGVAVLDTGCFPHEDIQNQLTAFCDVLQRHPAAYDDNGHGTHVCGIIAGNGASSHGLYAGIAPGCQLIPVKVLDARGNGYTSDVLTGLLWVRRRRREYNIRIVNISVGSLTRRNMSENSALVRGVDAAWDDGLIVVVAAGNMGPKDGSVTTPGISRKVITVGCSDDDREVFVMGNRLIDYSGRGPTAACVCKPDLIAPGASVTSCAPRPHAYIARSGTSMATPLVAGSIALLLEKFPSLTNRDVKLRLRETSTDLALPHNRQGWGLLNVKKLLEA
ncbi:MAG: S8 family peptidase [Clostridiales bacterium]|nr:S8 family peptidase [Clostridiales bacterium]